MTPRMRRAKRAWRLARESVRGADAGDDLVGASRRGRRPERRAGAFSSRPARSTSRRTARPTIPTPNLSRAREGRASSSSTRTRCIRRASRDCSRRSARARRRSTSTPRHTRGRRARRCRGLLARAGYRTALFHSGRFTYLGMDAVVAQQRFDTAEDAGAIGGNVQSSFGVDEPATVDQHAVVDRRAAAPVSDSSSRTCRSPATIRTRRPSAGPFAPTTDLDGLQERAPLRRRRARRVPRRPPPARARSTARCSSSSAITAKRSASTTATSATRCSSYEENIHVPLVIAAAGRQLAAHARECASARSRASIDVAPDDPRFARHGGRRRSTRACRCCARASGWRCSSPTTRSAGSACATGAGSSSSRWRSKRSRLYDLCRDPGETTIGRRRRPSASTSIASGSRTGRARGARRSLLRLRRLAVRHGETGHHSSSSVSTMNRSNA